MEYRKLGRFGVRVSEVGLGGWLTHGKSLDDSVTERIVQRAFELGINFFDTADAYNGGEAEKSLAKATQGIRREDLVLATKCYFPMGDGPNNRGLSRKHITESVHNSLKRLNTDYLDLMQFHRYDSETSLDETVRAIDDLVKQGKVLYWGVSEWKAHQITDLQRNVERVNANPPSSNQPVYNMLNRYIEESVLPVSQQFGMGQVVFSPLAQGVLSGKYLPGHPVPADSRAADSNSNMFMGGVLDEKTLTRVQSLKTYVEGLGYTLPQFALAWCLRQPGVSSVIVGATRVDQLEANVAASGLKLDAAIWSDAESILDGKEG